jgi:hypothetical protein
VDVYNICRDLHDNGFNGTLPDGLNSAWNILQL